MCLGVYFDHSKAEKGSFLALILKVCALTKWHCETSEVWRRQDFLCTDPGRFARMGVVRRDAGRRRHIGASGPQRRQTGFDGATGPEMRKM